MGTSWKTAIFGGMLTIEPILPSSSFVKCKQWQKMVETGKGESALLLMRPPPTPCGPITIGTVRCGLQSSLGSIPPIRRVNRRFSFYFNRNAPSEALFLGRGLELTRPTWRPSAMWRRWWKKYHQPGITNFTNEYLRARFDRKFSTFPE